MTFNHPALHASLELSQWFLLALLVAGLAAGALGLLFGRGARLTARSRHLILTLMLVMPVLLAPMVTVGVGRIFETPSVEVILPGTVVADLTPPAIEPRESSEILCTLFFLWIGGAAIFLALSGRQWLYWARVARRATPATEPALTRFHPRIAFSPSASEPMVVGLFRPTILLPVGYIEELDEKETEAMFAHELEHVRRRDNLTAALTEVVCGLFWFSPLHWISRRRTLELRERACDEGVLDRGCEQKAYLAALTKTCHAAIESPAVACMSGFHVIERIESIMTYTTDRTRFFSEKLVRFASVAGTLALLVAATAFVPAPVVASPAETNYQMSVELRPGPDGSVLAEISVFAPDGVRVVDAKVRTPVGTPVELSTDKEGRTYKVSVTPAADGSGVATLQVSRGSEITYASRKNIPAKPQQARSTAPPISLSLKDANIHDVLKVFGQLTGRRVEVDPALKGSITINVKGEPWDEVLLQVLAQAGQTAKFEGETIHVVPSNIKMPQLLSRVEPAYTPEGKAAGVAGVVVLKVSIDETGVVRDVEILKPLPFGLDKAAADAVRQWIFAPATQDGRPVPTKMNITVQFRP